MHPGLHPGLGARWGCFLALGSDFGDFEFLLLFSCVLDDICCVVLACWFVLVFFLLAALSAQVGLHQSYFSCLSYVLWHLSVVAWDVPGLSGCWSSPLW